MTHISKVDPHILFFYNDTYLYVERIFITMHCQPIGIIENMFCINLLDKNGCRYLEFRKMDDPKWQIKTAAVFENKRTWQLYEAWLFDCNRWTYKKTGKLKDLFQYIKNHNEWESSLIVKYYWDTY